MRVGVSGSTLHMLDHDALDFVRRVVKAIDDAFQLIENFPRGEETQHAIRLAIAQQVDHAGFMDVVRFAFHVADLSAAHSDDQLDRALAIFDKVGHEMGVLAG